MIDLDAEYGVEEAVSEINVRPHEFGAEAFKLIVARPRVDTIERILNALDFNDSLEHALVSQYLFGLRETDAKTDEEREAIRVIREWAG